MRVAAISMKYVVKSVTCKKVEVMPMGIRLCVRVR